MCPSLSCFQGGFVPESSSHCDMQCHEECAIFAAVPLCSRTLVEKLGFDCRLSKSHHYCSASVSYEKAFDKDESLVITQMVVLILRKSSCWPFFYCWFFFLIIEERKSGADRESWVFSLPSGPVLHGSRAIKLTDRDRTKGRWESDMSKKCILEWHSAVGCVFDKRPRFCLFYENILYRPLWSER